MGIDIYARWRGMTQEDEEAQITGFSAVHGHVGYLREAYHGAPYATRFLCREAFEDSNHSALIPAATLEKRLPETLRLAEERERTVYGETDAKEIGAILQSFREFVLLCGKKEREQGEPVEIIASF